MTELLSLSLSYLNGLVFSLLSSIKSEFCNELLISATVGSGLVFADRIELLHLWLQRM